MIIFRVEFILVEAAFGGNVYLTADDRLNPLLFCRLLELYRAVHNSVVGNGDGGLSCLLHGATKLFYTAGTV